MTNDEILEELREWYNVWQDDGELDAKRIILLFDDLDNNILFGDELPKEWQR